MRTVLIVTAALVVIAVGAYIGYQRELKRRRALEQFAASNGWTYRQRDDSFVTRFSGTPFGTGSKRRAKDVIVGSYRGKPMVAFEYSYEESSGSDSSTTYTFLICALELPTVVPILEVSPENALTRLANHLGFADIDFESEDFNRRFRVQSRDRKFAYDVLNARTMEFLMGRDARHWRTHASTIRSWKSGRLSSAAVLEHLDYLDRIVTNIPSFVWSDRGVSLQGAPAPQPDPAAPAAPAAGFPVAPGASAPEPGYFPSAPSTFPATPTIPPPPTPTGGTV